MKNKPIYKICRCALFTAVICICAFINIPVFTVPISLALFGIILCSVLLPPLEAFLSTAGYILIGIIGLPVFSSFSAGFGVLLGATGGYIWSYMLLSVIVSSFSRLHTKTKKTKSLLSFVGCVIGTAVCYMCGTIQYMYVCDTTFYTAVAFCILPFIPIDIIKALTAVFVGYKIKDRIN